MTVEDYLAKVSALVDVGCYPEAYDFGTAAYPEIEPLLTREQRERAYSIMEIAANGRDAELARPAGMGGSDAHHEDRAGV